MHFAGLLMIMSIFKYIHTLGVFSNIPVHISLHILTFKILKYSTHVGNSHREQLTEEICVTTTQVKKWSIASTSETFPLRVHSSHYPSFPKVIPIQNPKIKAYFGLLMKFLSLFLALLPWGSLQL